MNNSCTKYISSNDLSNVFDIVDENILNVEHIRFNSNIDSNIDPNICPNIDPSIQLEFNFYTMILSHIDTNYDKLLFENETIFKTLEDNPIYKRLIINSNDREAKIYTLSFVMTLLYVIKLS